MRRVHSVILPVWHPAALRCELASSHENFGTENINLTLRGDVLVLERRLQRECLARKTHCDQVEPTR